MPYQNDIGTVIESVILDRGVPFPIPVGSVLKIRFKKPNGQVITRTATVQTDGSDGIIEYEVVRGDFDQAGDWVAQGYVSFNDKQWSSDPDTFEVKSILRNKF